MKQVIFAIALLAMASLTGCLTDDEPSVDDNTDTTTDTTSDNTGNTNDNSNDDTDQDNTDTDDDGLIDPVRTDGGVTIPEDSSVFMDSGSYYEMGTYECNNPNNDTSDWSDDEEEFTCNYTYYQNDFFRNNYDSTGKLTSTTYIDVDGISNSLNFNGWVNKTGQTVTIEPLVYPDRGGYYHGTFNTDIDGDGANEEALSLSRYLNQPVNSNTCYSHYSCEIVFYGVNNLKYNAGFALGHQLTKSSWFAVDTDNDGIKDTAMEVTIYQIHTITFDLPFEPYGFEIIDTYRGDTDTVHRIF